MHIVLLHLSDIHFRQPNDRILDKAPNIASVINAIPQEIQLLVLAFTGDIAYSGKFQEYELFKRFVEELKATLKKSRNVLRIEVVMVPGNHDCDFSNEVELRRVVLDVVANAPNKRHDASIIEMCTSVQHNYFNAMAAIEGQAVESGLNKLAYVRTFSLNKTTTVYFRCFNTAWVSKIHEDQGELSFPLPESAPKLKHPSDISVAVFHHPMRWLHADNGRQFEKHIETTSDLVITGHEHVVGQYQKRHAGGEASDYYEGGALHTGTVPFSSEFNVILLDVERREHSSITYAWNSGRYERIAHTETRPLALSPQRQVGFKFSPDFEAQLLDPGAQLTHPAKKHLTIDDFYIFPDLRDAKAILERGGRVEVTRSKTLGPELRKRGKVVVYGDDSSGKTCLARAWTRSLLQLDIVPILVAATDFTSFTPEEIMRVVETRCAAQYGLSRHAEFAQLNASDRAILVDDCHRAQWYRTHRREMLRALETNFGTIVLFGSDLMRLNDVAYSEGEAGNPLLQYHKFDILPFGFELRRSLAEKWVKMGRDGELEGQDFSRKVHEATQALNSVIGKDLVPSHPIFLLVILQQLEALRAISSTTAASEASASSSYGTYGYFYQLLITRALVTGQEKWLDLDTSFRYLAEFAYAMYSQGTRRFDRQEVRRHHDTYCTEYCLTLDFDSLIRFFKNANVLKSEAEQFEFKYTYQYYYFVAYALSNSAQLEERLQDLIATIHMDESAGIIMFLVFLCRDERIISSVLQHARSLYHEIEPCNFDGDVAFLRELGHQPAALRLPASSARDNQVALMRERDRLSTGRLGFDLEDVSFDSDAEPQEAGMEEALDEIRQLNIAFKTIQILGQIIKNFPGSTKGSVKFAIVREAYSLGLRALRQMLHMIANNQGHLKRDLELWLQRRGVDPTEVGGRANTIIAWSSEALALTFILKTAEAVGLPKLAKTYDEIVSNDKSVGVRMIDLTVRLEHLPGFPENELNALRKIVHDQPFSRSILTRIAYRHFYLYDTTYKLRQRVCSSLDIGVPNRRVHQELKKGGR